MLETFEAIHELYRDKENFSKPLGDFIFQIIFSKVVEYLGASNRWELVEILLLSGLAHLSCAQKVPVHLTIHLNPVS